MTGAQGETGLSGLTGSTGFSGATGVLDSHVSAEGSLLMTCAFPARLVASAAETLT